MNIYRCKETLSSKRAYEGDYIDVLGKKPNEPRMEVKILTGKNEGRYLSFSKTLINIFFEKVEI